MDICKPQSDRLLGLRKDRRDIRLQEAPERIQGILAKHGLTGEAQETLLEDLLGCAHESATGTEETDNLQAATILWAIDEGVSVETQSGSR